MDTVLITGASRGIGRATALLAAERGWPVAINYRNDSEAAAETAAEVRSKGSRATTVRGDVSVEADVVGMFEKAQADLGPDRARRLGGGAPLGRAGKPEEIAEAIVWLLSGSSSYVTGSILDVAGGR